MGTRLTVDQLEKMKTHELADMLANVVLLLRRMPDVECKQLMQQVQDHHNGDHSEHVRETVSTYTRDELASKALAMLRPIAKALNVNGYSTAKKEILIERILAKSADGRSEQRALLDVL